MLSGEAASRVPDGADLPQVREAAAGCRACHLWERATQTVFGQGPARATVMLVGEQPGDREDLEGSPFVGPAAACWTGRWRRPASTAARSTSPTW